MAMIERFNDQPAAALSDHALSALLPMHLLLSDGGHVASMGATLARIVGPACQAGAPFFQHFRVQRPCGVVTWPDLCGHLGKTITVESVTGDRSSFRAIAVPVMGGGVVMNLSFGIGIVEGVRRFGLTQADFAPTDLTVEMLYLVEANTAIMDELRRLTLRLDGARHLATEEALTDPLTGLRNRRAGMAMLKRLSQTGQAFGVMHLDLDRFKAVNDSLGHAAGDHVLCQVAKILIAETREADTIVRLGGDEFVLIFPRTRDPERMQAVGKRLVERLASPIWFEGQECQIGASVGITLSSLFPNPDPDEILKDADDALYEAKRCGRGQVKMSGRLLDPAATGDRSIGLKATDQLS